MIELLLYLRFNQTKISSSQCSKQLSYKHFEEASRLFILLLKKENIIAFLSERM